MILTISFPEGINREFKMFRYPGGEVQVRLTEEIVNLVKHPKVERIHVVARIRDGEIMAMAQLLNTIKAATSADIRLILPYLPYARADRRFVLGDTLGLQVFGQLLNQISYDIVTLDAHSPEASKYIRHLTNVSPLPIIRSVIDQLDGTTTYGIPVVSTAVLLPDEGSRHRYGIPDSPYLLHATKKRDPETGTLSGFEAPPPDAFKADNILIVDDICDGGATFNGIADALEASGNHLPRYLYVTHGIFSKGYNELFKRFKKIYTTDSFGGLYPGNYEGLTIIPCMGTILDAVLTRSELWRNAAEEQKK